MSGEVQAIHRYARRDGIIVAAHDGKQSVQADYDALVLEELFADDAPDIVGILDGVADGQQLSDEECHQVRQFRERLKAACLRHNARQ